MAELRVNRSNGCTVKARGKFSHMIGLGNSLGGYTNSIPSGLSEEDTIQIRGKRRKAAAIHSRR
jgi:hypothetical protein